MENKTEQKQGYKVVITDLREEKVICDRETDGLFAFVNAPEEESISAFKCLKGLKDPFTLIELMIAMEDELESICAKAPEIVELKDIALRLNSRIKKAVEEQK